MPQQGFSLVELLMGLAIGAIVLSLVSPALATLKESNQRSPTAHREAETAKAHRG